MKVLVSKQAAKELRRVPRRIAIKFRLWQGLVEAQGIEGVRKTPGFHDEPLSGKRKGQRSIRLNRSYRAIYVELEDGTIRFIEVLEVNKHDY